MGRAFRGCCCGVSFLVVIVAAVIVWTGSHKKLPGIGNSTEMQGYTDSYQKAIHDYTQQLEKIMSDPKLKSAETAAQKHAAHIREMKQIVEAQKQCEQALQSIKPPPELAKFHAALLEYSHDVSEKYSELEASVKHKDVPELNVNVKRMDKSAENAAANVDKQLAQIPHYEQGKKQILDLWSRFKKQMDESAPPIPN